MVVLRLERSPRKTCPVILPAGSKPPSLDPPTKAPLVAHAVDDDTARLGGRERSGARGARGWGPRHPRSDYHTDSAGTSSTTAACAQTVQGRQPPRAEPLTRG